MATRGYILVHYNCEIVQNTQDGVMFCCPNPVLVRVCSSMAISELHEKILHKLQQQNRHIIQMLYRLPLMVGQGTLRFTSCLIQTDDDIGMMFDCHARFPSLSVMEVFVALGELNLSSGGSAPDPALVEGSLAQRSPTLAMSNPVQNENLMPENEYHLAGGQIGPEMNVGSDLAQIGPNLSYEDISNEEDSEEDPNEELFEDEMDEEAVPLAQGQSSTAQTQARSESQRVGHYSSLNFEAMEVNQLNDSNPMGLHGVNQLHEGQQFPNKESVLLAVKNYSIRKGAEYKVCQSDHVKYQGQCKHFGRGCNWSIRVIYRRKKGLWEIKKYNGEHTCLSAGISQRHSQLDIHVIAASIHSIVEADPTVPIRTLQASVYSKYEFQVSYRKAWLAKQKAIARIYGDWEDSYTELPKWLLALQSFMPGTIIEISTLPYYVGDLVDRSCVMFHRLFWTFPPCIEGFKHCKPFVTIDGTHLYGKYGGKLLMAIAQDGNSNIFPIAFAVVEGETTEAWSFFLTNLRRHVTPQEGILIISDRHAAIKAALDAEGSGWHPPNAYHAYCIRHIASNFARAFKSKDAKRALINAAYSKTQSEFFYYFELVRGEDPDMGAWVNRIPLGKWTQHQDEGRRYGHMTTNMSECINAVLKGVRNLPITALVKATYYRLAALFVKRGKQAEAQLAAGQEFSEALMRAFHRNSQNLGTMFVTNFSRSNESFVVEETQPAGNWSQRTYRVRLGARYCDCGEFQALHYPCRHVLAACAHTEARVEWGTYVDNVYRMNTVLEVYRMEFAPVANEAYWPPWYGPLIRPNPELRRAKNGRPVSTRIRNEMDEVESGHGKRCGLCRQEGHTRRRCPTLVATSSNQAGAGWWYKPEYIINELNINSVITTPCHEEILPINSWTTQRPYMLRGYAYSGGGRKVTRVEVTLDGGETWYVCALDHAEKPSKYGKYWCWCFWSLEVEVLDLLGAKEIAVRAWDESLNTQPEHLIWNVMGMMNNCWFKVKTNVCKPHKGEVGIVFEHPTQPGNQPGGWMAKERHLERSTESNQTLKKSVSTPFMNTASKMYSVSDVKKHNTPDSAWIIVHGHVYDCTRFLKDHPGGADSILINAGTDCTEEFDAIHSDKAKKLLEDYRIGELMTTGYTSDSSSPNNSVHGNTDMITHLAPIKEINPSLPLPQRPQPQAQLQPESRSVALNPRQKIPCKLVSKRSISHDVRLFRFALPDKDQLLGLPVGKHIFLCATVEGKLCMRAYTPTSSIDEVGYFDLVVKVYFKGVHPKFPNGGLMSQHLDSLPVGSVLDVKGPLGHIEYTGRGNFLVHGKQRFAKRLAMLAGGTGITPIYQVAQAILKDPEDHTEMHVVYANRTEEDILLREELDAWAEKYDGRFKVWYVVESVKEGWEYSVGYITESIIRAHVPEASEGTFALVCGPPPMIQFAVQPNLEKIGYDIKNDLLVF